MHWFRVVIDAISGLALLGMMLLTFFDVIGRTIFSQSIFGSLELTELLLLIVAFVALPSLSYASGHIVFDLLEGLLPARPGQILFQFANVVSGLVFAGAAWVTAVRAERSEQFGDVTAQFSISLWPFHYMVAFALLLTSMVHFLLAYRGKS